jgi:hypothetical protein
LHRFEEKIFNKRNLRYWCVVKLHILSYVKDDESRVWKEQQGTKRNAIYLHNIVLDAL